ncbi:MAG: hypothetical protein EOO42_22000, partial [Flavobacteriales bacterium]
MRIKSLPEIPFSIPWSRTLQVKAFMMLGPEERRSFTLKRASKVYCQVFAKDDSLCRRIDAAPNISAALREVLAKLAASDLTNRSASSPLYDMFS